MMARSPTLSPEVRQTIEAVLVSYSATLNADRKFVRDGKTLDISISENGPRLYFTNERTDNCVASGPKALAGSTVVKFVESFWYWTKP